MKYVFIVCLYLAAAGKGHSAPSSSGDSDKIPDTYTFASVREYPTYLHRCTATFVSSKVLLSTAECVLCPDDCKLQVRVLSDHLSDFGLLGTATFPVPQIYNVTQIIYHPEYPFSPETHNIALIVIDGEVDSKAIYNYADFTPEAFGIKGRMYSWQFSEDKKDYFLHRKEGATVANKVCSFSMNKYVPNSYMCVAGVDLLSMGPFDHGSPFIIKINNKPTVAGIYDDSSFTHNQKFVTYQSVAAFYKWIRYVISSVTPTPKPTEKTTTEGPTTTPNSPKPTTKVPKTTTRVPKTTTKVPKPTRK